MWEATYLLFYVSDLTLVENGSNNYCQIIKDKTQIHLWRDADAALLTFKHFKYGCWALEVVDRNPMEK